MSQVNWKGVFPAVTSKFTAADTIDWERMETESELENSLDIQPLPILKPIQQQALNLSLEKGKQANMALNAPFEETEEVGVVVLNQRGDLIYSANGEFNNLKELSFNPKFEKSANYVVRIFNSDHIYETTVQIVNL